MHVARASLGAGLVAFLVAGAPHADTGSSTAENCFRIYDATLYAAKPDLGAFGVEPILVVEPERWWALASSPTDAARRAATIRAVLELRPKPERIVLDLELAGSEDAQRRARNVAVYGRVLQWIRAAGYQGSLGFYGLLPQHDYWRAADAVGAQGSRDWRTENDDYRGLAALVDAAYPSLYTFYPDRAGWQRYARASLAEAHRIAPGLPVYPFLWPQYHNSNSLLAGRFIEREYWTEQLETTYAAADGIVIWGGWDFEARARLPWDAQAPWWLALRDFARSHDRVCRPVR